VAKSPELRRACEAWVSAALKLLANRRLYARPDLEITFSPGSHSARPIVSPDYRHLVTGTFFMRLCRGVRRCAWQADYAFSSPFLPWHASPR
jgi:hypothetical protein